MERPGRDGIAQQQDRGRRQTGRNRRQKSVKRFADVFRRVHPKLDQQRLAERAQDDLEDLQDAILRHEKLQIDARANPTATDPDSAVLLLVQVSQPATCPISSAVRHPNYGWGHLHFECSPCFG